MNSKAFQIRSLLEDTSTVGRAEQFLKSFIFGFLYIVQKDGKTNPYFIATLNIIQYLQLHTYLFREEMVTVWNSKDITNGLDQFLSHLQFVAYFDNFQTYSTFLLVQTGFIVLLYIALMYLGYYYYAYSNMNRTSASIMRVVLQICMTVLFMPIVGFQTNVWKCKVDSLGITSILGQECYTGTHIGYIAAAIINLILYGSMMIVILLSFFEGRNNQNDVTGKINGRSDALVQGYVLIQEIAMSIMSGSSFTYILLAINIGGSLVIFLAFAYNSPFYHYEFIRLHQIMSTILLWSAFTLCMATTMENNIIDGSLVVWFVGIPCIIGLVLTLQDRMIVHLVHNVNKLHSPDEVMLQTRYILNLLRWQHISRYSVLLDGYIEVHRVACDRKLECPLNYKKNRNPRLLKNVIDNNEEVHNEKQALLLLTFYKAYEHGLDKFEKHVDLRIQYAFFLLENMRYKRKALQELQRAEECDPSLDVQFMIYRYKRIVESEIQDDSNEKQNTNHEILPISAAPPIIHGLALCIEKSAYLHMEYWSELQDDTPDIAKLESLGKRVIQSINKVMELWVKLLRVSPNHQPSIYLYQQFQTEILNDNVIGYKLQVQLRKMMNGDNINKIDDIDSHDYSSDAAPIIVMTSDNGQIAQINQSCAGLFGYTRSELMNQKLSMLMPRLYGRQHDVFVDQFVTAQEFKYQSKDRWILGKNKSGYLQPLNIHIRPTNSIRSGIAFIGKFTIDKFFKNTAYILVDENGKLENMSSQCISVLKIDKRYFQTKKYISEIFPQIMNDKEQYISKTGGIITYSMSKDLVKIMEKSVATTTQAQLLNMDKLEDITYQLQCQCQEITFSTMFNISGYIFRFDKINELTASQLNSSVLSKKSHNLLIAESKRKKNNNNKFMLQYNAENKTIEGGYKEITSYTDIASRLDESVINQTKNNKKNSQNDISIDNSPLLELDKKQSEKQIFQSQAQKFKELYFSNRIEYDQGIRTMRLFQNKIQEIINDDDQIMEEEEQEYEGQQYLGVNQNILYDEGDELKEQDLDQFQSRAKLESLIDQTIVPIPIKFLRITETFITLSIISLAFVDYFLDVNQLQDMKIALDVFNLQTNLMSEFEYLYENVRDRQLLAANLFGSDPTFIEQQDTILRQQMQSSIIFLQESLNYIVLSDYQFPSQLTKLYTEPSIVMNFNQSRSTVQDFQEASAQMLSYALYILNSNISVITFNSTDVALYFLLNNGHNTYLDALLTAQDITMRDFIDKTADRSNNFIIIVVVAAVILTFSFGVIVIILLSIRLTKEYVIILFLELPNKVVKQLFLKCETFVKFVTAIGGDGSQQGDNNEDMDQQLEGEDQQFGLMQDSKKKKKKKFKNTTEPPIPFYIQLFVIAGLMEAYFIMTLVLQKDNLNDIRQIVYEANSTILAESAYALASNTLQGILINPNTEIQGGLPAEEAVHDLYQLYELDSKIHSEHSHNIAIHEQLYTEAFNTIMFLDPCERINSLSNITIEECSNFADGSIKSGYTVALTRYFENLRYLQTQYFKTLTIPTPSLSEFDPNLIKVIIMNEPVRDLQLNLLNLVKMKEVKNLQRKYFKYGMRYLGDMFIDSIQVKQDKYKDRKIGLFIAYILLIMTAYLIYWIPFHRHLQRDIWQTKMSLLMIPVDNLIRLRNAKLYIKNLINSST